jgi:hypothetical protein
MQEALHAKYLPARVRDANFTIEQPFKNGSVFRVTYVFTHGSTSTWSHGSALQLNYQQPLRKGFAYQPTSASRSLLAPCSQRFPLPTRLSGGIQTSYWTPRQVQLSARISF